MKQFNFNKLDILVGRTETVTHKVIASVPFDDLIIPVNGWMIETGYPYEYGRIIALEKASCPEMLWLKTGGRVFLKFESFEIIE